MKYTATALSVAITIGTLLPSSTSAFISPHKKPTFAIGSQQQSIFGVAVESTTSLEAKKKKKKKKNPARSALEAPPAPAPAATLVLESPEVEETADPETTEVEANADAEVEAKGDAEAEAKAAAEAAEAEAKAAAKAEAKAAAEAEAKAAAEAEAKAKAEAEAKAKAEAKAAFAKQQALFQERMSTEGAERLKRIEKRAAIREREEVIAKARAQPKPEEEEKALADKYGAMPLEERAFAILVDLGMITLHEDPDSPDYDHSDDNEFVV